MTNKTNPSRQWHAIEVACRDYRRIIRGVRGKRGSLVWADSVRTQGATPRQINALKTLLGFELPQEVADLLSRLSVASDWLIDARVSEEFEFMTQSDYYWGVIPLAGHESTKQSNLAVMPRVYVKDRSYARIWSHRWRHALIIAENIDGDHICVDLRHGHTGEVFAASHDNDYFSGKVICDNITSFFAEWLRLGMISPSEPILSLCTDGFTKPFSASKEPVTRWRKWLRVD